MIHDIEIARITQQTGMGELQARRHVQAREILRDRYAEMRVTKSLEQLCHDAIIADDIARARPEHDLEAAAFDRRDAMRDRFRELGIDPDRLAAVLL